MSSAVLRPRSREGAPPVVLDFATSLFAEGRSTSQAGGKPLPSTL